MKISFSKLCKEYHDADRSLKIIDNLDFVFPDSGTVAILGKSGIGKSTLLHLLGGLDRPSSGRILYDQLDISQLNDQQLTSFRGENIGFIFQFHHLLPEFTALENVAMPLIVNRLPNPLKEAESMLERLGLGSRISHLPGQLSGGEQQRVALARALATKPKVVLADEPTGNLDVATALETQNLLKQVVSELKGLLLVVTHSLELASSLDMCLEMQVGGQLKVYEMAKKL